MTDMREKIAGIRYAGTTIGNGVADAIIAALPGMVKPLEFWASDTGDLCCDSMIGRYQIQKGTTRWCCMYAMGNKRRPSGNDAPTYHKSENGAKAAAQAHYVAAALEPFGVQGGGDTIDAQAATIKALVEALEKVLVEYDKLDNVEPASMTSAYFEAKKAITAARGTT